MGRNTAGRGVGENNKRIAGRKSTHERNSQSASNALPHPSSPKKKREKCALKLDLVAKIYGWEFILLVA